VICSFSIKYRGGNDFQQACSTPEAVFGFSIEGGAEIPHFCLHLNLKHPNDDSMSLSFRVIWTAWGERGFYSERAQNDPDTNPDETHVYSFSNRLHDVQLFRCVLDRSTAMQCMGKVKAAGYAVVWSHDQPPYQCGFDIPDGALQALSPGQRWALDIFRLTKNIRSQRGR
jgi:hypothetical protein